MARRTQRQLDKDIERATSDIVLERGVAGITMREVAKRSRADINVLVRRFQTDEGLVSHYVRKFDYFINDALVFDEASGDSWEERFRKVATQFEKALHHNLEMQEIMKWQLSINSKTTRASARRREQTLTQIIDKFISPISSDQVNPRALLAVLIAGMYYITLRNDRSTFVGLDFHTRQGRALLIETMVQVVSVFVKDQSKPACTTN